MRATYRPKMPDEKVEGATGKTWTQWFALLDAWGARTKGHTAIAKWLSEKHGVSGWWSQTVAVEYERARGIRKVGQNSTGDFVVSVQRTVAAPPGAALAAFKTRRARAGWIADAALREAITAGRGSMRQSETAMAHMLRVDLAGDVGGRLEVAFQAKGSGTTVVSLQHSGLGSKAHRDDVKQRWVDAMDALKRRLGQG